MDLKYQYNRILLQNCIIVLNGDIIELVMDRTGRERKGAVDPGDSHPSDIEQRVFLRPKPLIRSQSPWGGR